MVFMKKSFLILVVLLILVFAFSACSAKGDSSYYPSEVEPSLDNDSDSDASEEGGTDTLTNESRKIIYSIDSDLNVDDFDKSVKDIKSLLIEGEWFDYESTSSGYAYFIARIKTDRLDDFIEDLSALSTDFYYTKSSNDISLNYSSKENRIAALTEEKNLILTYAETLDATPYEFLQRIAQINTEIARLNADLNQYDSLMEYSEVSIRVRQNYVPQAQAAYKDRANNVFYGAWEAFKDFFEFIGLAIIAIFPFLLVIAPVTCGIIFLTRFKKRKPPFDKIKRKQNKHKTVNDTASNEKAEGNDKL